MNCFTINCTHKIYLVQFHSALISYRINIIINMYWLKNYLYGINDYMYKKATWKQQRINFYLALNIYTIKQSYITAASLWFVLLYCRRLYFSLYSTRKSYPSSIPCQGIIHYRLLSLWLWHLPHRGGRYGANVISRHCLITIQWMLISEMARCRFYLWLINVVANEGRR